MLLHGDICLISFSCGVISFLIVITLSWMCCHYWALSPSPPKLLLTQFCFIHSAMQNEVSKWSHYSPLNLKYEASPFGLLTHICLCLSVLVPELTSSPFFRTTIQWISASSNSPHGIYTLTRIIYSKCINSNTMERKPCEIVFTNYVNNWEMAKKRLLLAVEMKKSCAQKWSVHTVP